MTTSPASLIQRYLVTEGVFDDPEDSGATAPLYVAFLPDKRDEFALAAAVHDTTGLKDGRYMRGGQSVMHPGIQIMVRAQDYDVGFGKAQAALDALEASGGATVTVSSAEAYVLHSVSATGPVLSLGAEEGSKRRFLFTVNFLATIEEE